jgi:hypothetical protein
MKDYLNKNRIRVDPEFKSELEKAFAEYKKDYGSKTSMSEFTKYLVIKRKDQSNTGKGGNNAKKELFDFRF